MSDKFSGVVLYSGDQPVMHSPILRTEEAEKLITGVIDGLRDGAPISIKVVDPPTYHTLVLKMTRKAAI